MATLKDVARKAGVSYGTVSNVLNGKGNVTSKTSRLVEETARQLGYTIDQRAKGLRKGRSNTLAVVLPTLFGRPYADFYTSFRLYAESLSYQTAVYATDDIERSELHHIGAMHANITAGVAAFTCLQDPEAAYAAFGRHVVFVDRRPSDACGFVGFDFEKAGEALQAEAARCGYRRVLLVMEREEFSSQRAFLRGFQRHAKAEPATLFTGATHCHQDLLDALGREPQADAIFVSNELYAQRLMSLAGGFFAASRAPVYALTSLFTLPETSLHAYELNYRLLGRTAAEQLIGGLRDQKAKPAQQLLPADGLRSWTPRVTLPQPPQLTIATPTSRSLPALRNVARLYTQATGTRINIAIYSYEALSELINSAEGSDRIDIVRMDCHRLSACAERILAPLEDIDPDAASLFDALLPGLSPADYRVRGALYALPGTPSVQMLFYRKDLFENPALRRQYAEQHKLELLPPNTFEEFNRIARFFTRRFNPHSPVAYGTALTLGSDNYAAGEYLTRYFSHAPSMYEGSRILLDTPEALQSMEELLALRDLINPRFNNTLQETARDFSQGDVAMSILFGSVASAMVGRDSRVFDRAAFAMIPGENPMLAGNSLGINRYSANKRAALDFLRWLLSAEVSAALAYLGAASPNAATYRNYEVIDKYPWLGMTPQCMAGTRIRYVPEGYDKPFDEFRFLSILGMAVHSAYSGVMSAAEALRLCKSMFEKHFCAP